MLKGLARKATQLGLIKAGNVVLSLLVGIVLARALGPEQYGLYALLMSVAMLLTIPVKSGLPTLVLRELTRALHAGSSALVTGVLRAATVYWLVGSLLVVTLAGLAFHLTGWPLREPVAIWLALAMIPVLSLMHLDMAHLRARKRPVQSQVGEQVVKPALFLTLSAVLFLTGEPTLERALVANLLATVLGLILYRLLTRRYRGAEHPAGPAEYHLRAWATSLLPLSLFAAIKLFDAQINLVLLGLLADPASVAYYRVAFQGAVLVGFALTAVNLVIAPYITQYHQDGDTAALQGLISRVTPLVTLFAVVLVGVYMAMGRTLIDWVFGAEYQAAYWPLLVLSLGYWVNCATGPVALTLNMTGYERQTLWAIVLGLILNGVLALLLIPLLGAVGGAIAAATSMTVWNGLLARRCYRLLGIKPFAMNRVAPRR